MARIRLSVAEVAVFAGQKYGFRMVNSARLLSFAFLPSLIDTFGLRQTLPSRMAKIAYTVRQTRVMMSTVVGLVLPLSIAVELEGRNNKTMHLQIRVKK